jgi:hypothetical protein
MKTVGVLTMSKMWQITLAPVCLAKEKEGRRCTLNRERGRRVLAAPDLVRQIDVKVGVYYDNNSKVGYP